MLHCGFMMLMCRLIRSHVGFILRPHQRQLKAYRKMPKSDCKKLYSSLFDEAGFSCSEEPPHEIHYVLQDGSVVLRRIAGVLGSDSFGGAHVSESDVVLRLFGDSLCWLHNFADVCVFVCDKPSYVTLAKCPEQRRRDASGGALQEEAALALETWFGVSDAALDNTGKRRYRAPGRVWACVLNDRSTRKVIVPFLMRCAARVLGDMIPQGKHLIIDYEDEEPGGAPVALHGCTKSNDDDGKFITGSMFTNTIGEFDNCIAFWSNALSNAFPVHRPCLLVDTIDTDLMFICTMLSENRRHDPGQCQLLVRFRQSFSKKCKHAPGHQFVHTGILASRIAKSACVEGVVKASVLGGSDFNAGFDGISHKTLLEAYMGLSGKRGLASPLLRDAVTAAIHARYPRSAPAKMPSSDRIRGEIARAEWTIEYWRCHFDGAAHPGLPHPGDFVGTESKCAGWQKRKAQPGEEDTPMSQDNIIAIGAPPPKKTKRGGGH